MFFHRSFMSFLKVFAVLFLLTPALAQFVDLCKFKGVEIPYRLKYQDATLEKGRYDLETLKNPTTPSCYLRIKKGGKVLCLIEGERLDYEVHGMARMSDPSIPDNCTLKMKKNPEEKVLYLTVHTGRKNAMFPFLLLRFKLTYEE
jgi:hypothetical protein